MPGKNTPVQSAQILPALSQNDAIQFAMEAVDHAALGMECIHELRAILRAIYRLSGADETIHELAHLGVSLADDRHNLLDCEAADAKENLAAMKGGVHA